jgi:hypothetical protein
MTTLPISINFDGATFHCRHQPTIENHVGRNLLLESLFNGPHRFLDITADDLLRNPFDYGGHFNPPCDNFIALKSLANQS